MKRCSTCHEFKDFFHFNRRAKAYDGLQARCREWYARNRREHMKNVRRRNDEERERIKLGVREHLAKSSRIDSGETDVRVLEFDHRPDTKKIDDVGTLYSPFLF